VNANDSLPPRTWAEISPAALRANARAVRRRCPEAGIIAVIKADAYGHGAALVAEALENDVAAFAVANLAEALTLPATPARPVLILSPALPEERAPLAAAGFIPTISSAAELAAFAGLARTRPLPVSLKIDTGMGRAGAFSSEAAALLEAARTLAGIEVRHIASHLPSADTDAAYTEHQLETFAAFAREQRPHFPGTTFHILNSAGILGFGRWAQDLVRPGLMLYGVSPLPEFQSELQPACTWKTRVCLVRELPAGHGVSYGRRFVTRRPTRTALLAAGYADGYPRILSGRGAEVLIRGKRCPVLGTITMDLTIVDVTGLPEAAAGDEAVLLGAQGGECIHARELADKAETIPWEILTGIQNRVQRRLA